MPATRLLGDVLTFVGLGLYDERSITRRGADAVAAADRVFLEWYTSRLAGADVETLEAVHDVDIEVRDRAGIEGSPEPILDTAAEGHAAVLVAGDPMISTTHVDLRLRAHDRGIDTRVVHGTTAQTAASSLTGLQNYRFGKATTLPFPDTAPGAHPPSSVLDTVRGNLERDLHTIVYLDIDAADERYLRADAGAAHLADPLEDRLLVGIARAGSDDPTVLADRACELAGRDFGDGLHLLVVPAVPHPMEREALVALADAPVDAIPEDA